MTLKTLPVIQSTPPPPPPQQHQSLLPWIFLDTRRKILICIIFSPILIPLFCIYFPLICLARLYFHLCNRRRREKRRGYDGMRRCEEGRGRESVAEEEEREIGWLLMQRYLEDQLELVVGSVVAVYDCGHEDDEDEDDDDQGYFSNFNNGVDHGGHLGDENRRPLLV